MKKIMLQWIFPIWYRLCCIQKVDKNYLLFVEVRLFKLSSNFKTIRQELLSPKVNESEVFYLKMDSISQAGYFIRCLILLKKIASAKYIFLNEGSNVVSAINLRKGSFVIQTWHACGAFKKFGYSLPKKPMEEYYKNTTFVTVSSPAVIPYYQEAMHLPKERILALGVSRTDCFFDTGFLKKKQLDFQKKVEVKGKKIIVYAPTFRDNIGNQVKPRQLQIELLYQALKDDYIFLIKQHPALRGIMSVEEKYQDFLQDVSDRCSIEELMVNADILITDYSSLIFEYVLFEKPVLFFAYDLDEYQFERGFYEPYEEFVPGPVVKTEQEIIRTILSGQYFDREKIKNFKQMYMQSCEGNATKRIIDKIRDLS